VAFVLYRQWGRKQTTAAATIAVAPMYSGCCCCYNACNFEDIKILCEGAGTCICIEEKCCLAANVDQFPVGMIKEEGFICKIGLPCCTTGLKMPDAKDLLSGGFQCLCLKALAQFPFGDKIGAPVCAVCFLQCTPDVGCLKPPPSGGAPPVAAPEGDAMAR